MSKGVPDPCPCGRGAAYADCCARFHRGEPAPDAEALMRSRYSAFVLRLADYLRHLACVDATGGARSRRGAAAEVAGAGGEAP